MTRLALSWCILHLALALPTSLDGQERLDIWKADVAPDASRFELLTGAIAPRFDRVAIREAEPASPSLGGTIAGSVGGWTVGALIGFALPNTYREVGMHLGGSLGAGLGAHFGNDRAGLWPIGVLSAASGGALMILPVAGLCWEGCDGRDSVLLGVGLGTLQVTAATLAERRLGRARQR